MIMSTDGSAFLPSLDSFQIHVPFTSTPKRSTRVSLLQPLSSTLSMPNETSKPMDLSISAITLVSSSPVVPRAKRIRCSRRRRTHLHPSTIIKRIELKYLLYSTRTMKQQQSKQGQYTDTDMKIYVV